MTHQDPIALDVLVGRAILVPFKLERAIEACIHRCQIGDAACITALLAPLSFRQKLDVLRDLAAQRYAFDDPAFKDISLWRKRLRRMHTRRLGLIHQAMRSGLSEDQQLTLQTLTERLRRECEHAALWGARLAAQPRITSLPNPHAATEPCARAELL